MWQTCFFWLSSFTAFFWTARSDVTCAVIFPRGVCHSCWAHILSSQPLRLHSRYKISKCLYAPVFLFRFPQRWFIFIFLWFATKFYSLTVLDGSPLWDWDTSTTIGCCYGWSQKGPKCEADAGMVKKKKKQTNKKNKFSLQSQNLKSKCKQQHGRQQIGGQRKIQENYRVIQTREPQRTKQEHKGHTKTKRQTN